MAACIRDRVGDALSDSPQARRFPTREQWRRWMELGEVLLLLDGMDEVDAAFAERVLTPSLRAHKQAPCVLTCRTVSFEKHRALAKELQIAVFHVEGMEEGQQKSYIEAFLGGAKAAKLIAQLRVQPAMVPLAAKADV